jgi:S-adenosylmethionine synthetase
VRETIKEVGYTRAKYGFEYETCAVLSSIHEQSPDIAMGVDPGGAGDQGLMFGFACTETEELMPLPIMLAHKLCRGLSCARRDGVLDYLRPDGKSQVTVEYEGTRPVRVDTVVISSQHSALVNPDTMREDIVEKIVNRVVPQEMLDNKTRVLINPTGRFVIGGPQGDAGVTGRKIIVDTYGGAAPHGGGAFSGKDPTKVDRSACYMARYIAKNCVAAGLADRVLVQLAYAIGVAEPVSVLVDTQGTGRIPDQKISELVRAHFKMTPRGIMEELDLRRPIYRRTAAFGHFGRTEPEFTWERTDRAAALRADAGL